MVELTNTQRDFKCSHCDGRIVIPIDLPPTTAPCPHCSEVITSPALEGSQPASAAAAITEPPNQTMEVVEPALASGPENAPVDRGNPTEPKVENPENAPLRSRGLVPALMVVLALLIVSGVVGIFAVKQLGSAPDHSKAKPTKGNSSATEANYQRIGWRKDALHTLQNYLEATTVAAKVPHVIDGSQIAAEIEDFYGGGQIMDSDTPAEAFSFSELSDADKARGLFMMIFDQPPQFEMKEFFRPLTTLEVQYGVDEADLLLSTLARAGNFAMEPLRVHAFFKREADGLKLDWKIFAQTKYRTFQNFVELPDPGHTGTFRVLIEEDVPDKGKAVTGTRTYHLMDPANMSDSARVNVKVDSDIGKVLSVINWRGSSDNRPPARTATLELRWAGESNSPVLEISQFICWEFLGLGGSESTQAAANQ